MMREIHFCGMLRPYEVKEAPIVTVSHYNFVHKMLLPEVPHSKYANVAFHLVYLDDFHEYWKYTVSEPVKNMKVLNFLKKREVGLMNMLK
jgi:hypothetical protein